jgi:hypothetical protein
MAVLAGGTASCFAFPEIAHPIRLLNVAPKGAIFIATATQYDGRLPERNRTSGVVKNLCAMDTDFTSSLLLSGIMTAP